MGNVTENLVSERFMGGRPRGSRFQWDSSFGSVLTSSALASSALASSALASSALASVEDAEAGITSIVCRDALRRKIANLNGSSFSGSSCEFNGQKRSKPDVLTR